MSNVVPFTGQVDRDGSALNFFAKVLPASGLYCAALKKQTGKLATFENVFCESIEALWTTLRDADRSGREVYFALASFSDNRRKIEHVYELQALSCDVDYGNAGHSSPGYETYEDATNALAEFIKKVPLPVPIVLTSGGGLQIHWPLEEPMEREKWQRYADGLKAACLEYGFKTDTGLTINSAHIMRPPWTQNLKLIAPRLVELKLLSKGPYDEADFEILLQFAPRGPSRAVRFALPASPTYALPEAPAESFPDRYEVVNVNSLRGCGVVEQFTKSGDCCEPTWMRMAAVFQHVVDGERLFHEYSEQNYSRYNRRQAQEKYDRAANLTGPPKCEGFKDNTDEKTRAICLACPHLDAIVTPLALGSAAEESEEERTEPEQKKAPYSLWDKTKEDHYRPTFKNATIAIGKIELTCKHDTFHLKKWVDGEELSDAVIRVVHEQIITRFKFDPGVIHIREALERECERNGYDPVSDYLRSLGWDNHNRLDRWLTDYLGCSNTALNRAFGRKC